jgi:hypothetical protein
MDGVELETLRVCEYLDRKVPQRDQIPERASMTPSVGLTTWNRFDQQRESCFARLDFASDLALNQSLND